MQVISGMIDDKESAVETLDLIPKFMPVLGEVSLQFVVEAVLPHLLDELLLEDQVGRVGVLLRQRVSACVAVEDVEGTPEGHLP
jgi:hypothetical protein